MSRSIHYNERRCWISFFHDVTERRKAHEVLVRERRTLKHMLRASDHERQLIAYDIHDGLAQQLAGAIMQLQTYGHLKRTKPKAAAKAFDAGMTMLRQGHSEARRLVSGVRPPILYESGRSGGIAHLVNDPTFQGKPHAIFHSDVMFSRLTPILENVIYRIVQEGLTNASKHSQSEMVRVNLRQREETKFASRFEIGASASIQRLCQGTVLDWPVFGNGHGCWVASAGFRARWRRRLTILHRTARGREGGGGRFLSADRRIATEDVLNFHRSNGASIPSCQPDRLQVGLTVSARPNMRQRLLQVPVFDPVQVGDDHSR